MNFDKYSMYSQSALFNSEKGEVEKVLAKLEELRNYTKESEAREFLLNNWQIRNDVWNYTIANNLIMHVYNGKEYFNITYENLDENHRFIKSFNFIKNK